MSQGDMQRRESRRDFVSRSALALAGIMSFGLPVLPLRAQDNAQSSSDKLQQHPSYAEFLDWVQQEEDDFSALTAAEEADLNQWRRRQQGEFDDFVDFHDRALQDYVADIESAWGGAPRLRDRTTWVDYSGKNNIIRRVVDFVRGYAEVTVIDDSHQQPSSAPAETAASEAKAGLHSLFNQNLKDLLSKDSYEQAIQDWERTSGMSDARVLPQQEGKSAESKAALSPLFPGKSAIDAARPKRQTLANGKQATSVRVPIRNAVTAKAAPYLPEIYKRARQYDIPPSIILSIIHVESAFNPLATSHVPAYGLMQIVPTSAGADITEFLVGEKLLLPPRWLYNAANNIHAGCAYLHLLDKRYLAGISDEVSRMCCVIAAYNTGPSNMAKAFTSRGLDDAIYRINRMSAADAYRQLRRKLPYRETRVYLPKVLQQISRFSGWSESSFQ